MASPVAHSFAGFWVFLLSGACQKVRLVGHRHGPFFALAILVFVANMPDLDFLLSLIFRGNLNELHRGFTHSWALAAVCAVVLACALPIAESFWRSVAAYFAAYGSHLLIDLCTGTALGFTNSGSGIPLFWPSRIEYSSPLILVLGVRHENLPSVWSMGNAWSCIYELVICGGITAIMLGIWTRCAQNNSPRLMTAANIAGRPEGRGQS